ncbi:MAG: hypothetical protein JXA93_10595 [Anaerolineae bacterium]|nr:hypothetical protein [Anaerolineae bacterium]
MMSGNDTTGRYERRITPIERLFMRSPMSVVTMVVRIRGNVSVGMVRDAVDRVRLRHPNLRVRIVEDERGNPWFTSEGAGEIAVDTVPRVSDDQWIEVVQESCRVPFEFEARPAVRFTLLESGGTSDLAIVCHHILCDGLSLAYLARDLMLHLGEPARETAPLPDPVPIDINNVPPGAGVNRVVRWMVERLNKRWRAEKVTFDQEDYRDLARTYWSHYPHKALSVELAEAQTAALVERCRKEEVTVNSALAAAFAGAQVAVQGAKPFHARFGVAASVRDRLPAPAGEAMGFYAGLVEPEQRYDVRWGFWENARQLHGKVRPLLTDKKLFQNPLLWCYLDPTILEAINFKKLGGLVPEGAARHEKLSAFGAREDTVLAVLKRDRMESLDRIGTGTAVTNLTRLDFPTRYGALELERLILKPGGAFPLVNVNLVLGAVTCAGKLSLVVEFVEQNVDTATMGEIKDTAMGFLLAG